MGAFWGYWLIRRINEAESEDTMTTIIVEVSPTGETKIETRGFKGKSCKDATRELEKALGAVTSDTATSEAYEHGGIHVRNRA